MRQIKVLRWIRRSTLALIVREVTLAPSQTLEASLHPEIQDLYVKTLFER